MPTIANYDDASSASLKQVPYPIDVILSDQ